MSLQNIDLNKKYKIINILDNFEHKKILESKGIFINQQIYKIYKAPLDGDASYCLNNARIISFPRSILKSIIVKEIL